MGPDSIFRSACKNFKTDVELKFDSRSALNLDYVFKDGAQHGGVVILKIGDINNSRSTILTF